ncbi:hypothetical protein LAZ67_7001709 [Cordylochernes scorpioides]|uniref:Reverse transcriptase domain-containing protein n=1 Tax=Cordylochernes scorpioides TaxID=51811 RepID=A0ABY6KP29_9ARAC|nr:hypothetical protein LAZ67_7001709 [Cordylochernes scorpioides]
MWFDNIINQNGRRLQPIIDFHNMLIHNNRNKTCRGLSIIDLTITNSHAHVLVNGWKTLNLSQITDHHAISFDISLETESLLHENNSTWYFQEKRANWQKYEQAIIVSRINEAMMKLGKIVNINDINCVVSLITDILIEAAYASLRLKPKYLNNNPFNWWTDELELFKNHFKYVRNLYYRGKRSNRQLVDEKMYKEIRNKYMNIIEKQEMSFDLPILDVSQDVLESEMKNLLSSLFPNDCQSSDTNYHKLIRDKSYTFSNDKIIYFDNIQICSIIKKLKNGKAPGIDHISNQMIKTAVHHISPVLTKLFNACIGLNYYPEAWRKSAVMIIKKPNKKNYKDPKAYRPISLSSNLGKIFESLIHIELLNHINSNNVMHPAQHGFTQEKSTISALQEITKLSLLKRETENTAIVTVDISGAFDNAWHPAILQQLDKANFPAVLIKIINSYFEDRSVEFKYTNVKCIKKINKGCPQGGIISPILWNILLNDFNLSFNESFARVIAFADDVTFVVWSSNIYDLQYNITKCLIKIKAWCEKVKLSLSPNKTGILYLHNYEKLPINFDGKIIQPSETVKILGVIFKNHRQRNKINFGTHVDNIIMKATKLKNILFSLCARTWGIDTRRRLILYKAMIRSTISYASNIWFPFITAAKRSKLNSIQYQILIRCIHAYRTSSSYITHILAKTPLLSDYLELSQTKVRSEDPSVYAVKGRGLAFLIKNLYYEDIAVNITNTLDLEAQGIKVYLNQNKVINIYNMYHPPNNKLIDNGTMAQFLTDNSYCR